MRTGPCNPAPMEYDNADSGRKGGHCAKPPTYVARNTYTEPAEMDSLRRQDSCGSNHRSIIDNAGRLRRNRHYPLCHHRRRSTRTFHHCGNHSASRNNRYFSHNYYHHLVAILR